MVLTDSFDVAALWKSHAPRLLAALVQRLRNLQAAEDALAFAFEQVLAWRTFSFEARPNNPAAWIYRVALNAALDQQRKHTLHNKLEPALQAAAEASATAETSTPDGLPPDDRLAMLFLCAHPSLSADSQAMLMLRFCAGLSLADIARWFFQPVAAVQRRLHRAKEKLAQAGARFALPSAELWPERLPPVLSAIEIIYDQSYSNVGGGQEQDGFAREAEQLVLALCDQLPDPEVLGLAAVIVFGESRRASRLRTLPDARRVMVPLAKQDCTQWDQQRLRLAARLLRLASRAARPGPYQIKALISAQHARRLDLGFTPWLEIHALYGQLQQMFEQIEPDSAAIHALQINQLLALACSGSTDEALVSLLALQQESTNDANQIALQLALAHVRLQLGDANAARAHWQNALQLAAHAPNPMLGQAERHWIEWQIEQSA